MSQIPEGRTLPAPIQNYSLPCKCITPKVEDAAKLLNSVKGMLSSKNQSPFYAATKPGGDLSDHLPS